MTKEIYISSTPHETRLAVVEDDQLAEIYYERENEYTLAGSIYKGKVTRVLPGMQSAFVDIGLERDAFLYVTDFAEEQEDEEYVQLNPSQSRGHESRGQESQERSDRNHRNGSPRDRSSESQGENAVSRSSESTNSVDPESEQSLASSNGNGSGTAGRRWRGRRGRRRGRGGSQAKSAPDATGESTSSIEPAEYDTNASAQDAAEGQESAASSPAAEDFSRSASAESHIAHPQQVPVVLPGESISKYRHGEVSQPAESIEQKAPAAPRPTFQPSTLVTGPLAWDGGEVLPGESISRYRHSPASDPQPVKTSSSPAAEVGPAKEEKADSHSDEATSSYSEQIHPPDADSSHESETPEFEPEEGSASYRFDPSGPSAFRRGSVMEPPAEEPSALEETSSVAPETELAQEPSFVSEEQPEVPDAQHEMQVIEATDCTGIESFTETGSEISAETSLSTSADSVEAEHHAYIGEDFAAHLEEDALDDHAESDHDEHAFDPGHGNLEEEVLDEEEPESYVSQSLTDEKEYDELIEETLDMQQMDSGLLSDVVRDRHIDKRTQSDQGGDESADDDDSESSAAASSFGEVAFAAELEDVEVDDAYSAEGNADDTESTHGDSGPSRSARIRSPRRGARGQRHNGHGGDRRARRATAQMTNLPAITELLKPNQEILVQIAKEPIARKGARITSHIALPGRFLVFMPTVNHVGVSRKISSDEERQRLKHILVSEKGNASGGFIVRTAAASASEEDLRADIRFLLTLWADIRQRMEAAKPPALIYHDLNLVERVLRDQVTDNFSAIWVDSEADYERVLRFLNRFEPALVRRVKLYTKETPLFEQFGIQEEINNALRSKVWLKSGGSIVINQTEALVAIDINTGKYVGKTARLEDTIVKTNLDAIPEIVRQIRLRDLGGIIVIDFIDMDERKNRHRVMQALEEELKLDRAPSKVLQFNDFGLVAITRKRVKQSLERTLSVPCSVCAGTGMVKGPMTVCNEIYIELRKMSRQIDRGDVLLRVNPEVVKQLKASNGRWLSEMEEMSGKTIIVKSDATLHPEKFDIQ